MKKNLLMCAAMLCALVLASCGSDAEFAKFIPKEAAVVGRIDVQQMVEKGNLSDNEQLTVILQKAVKESGMTAKGKVTAEKLISDPKSAGIDFRKPVFYYYNNDDKGDHFGLIGTVLNTEDLKNFCNYLAEENGGEATKEYNGVNYTENDDVIVAFNDKWLIIKDMSNTKAQDVINTLLACEDLKPDMTIEGNESFKHMLKGNGVAQTLIRGKAFNESVLKNNPVLINSESALKNISDLDYILNLDAKDGELYIDYETLATTEESRKKLEEYKNVANNIAGDYANSIDKDAILSFIVNFNGKEAFKVLEKNGFKDEYIAMAKPYLEAINGDIAFTFNTVKANLKELDMRYFMHLNDTQPFTALKAMFSEIPNIKEVSENEFSLSMSDMLPVSELVTELGLADESENPNPGNIMSYFGVNKNKDLYATLSINNKAFDKVKNPIEKGNYNERTSYIRLNFIALSELVKLINKNKGQENDYEFKTMMRFFELIDYIEAYSTKDQKGKMRCMMQNKEKNALATFFGEIISTVNS